VTGETGGFDSLAGAGSDPSSGTPPPAGIRTVPPFSPTATRLVLIRHGEAVCNVSGVCGGTIGCQGLTDTGRRQVELLRDRLLASGELADADVLYASLLPRAIETAELLAPALAPDLPGGGRGPVPELVTECGVCELHPGESDGLTWTEYAERFGPLDWDLEPDRPIAPGGESWTGFVNRVATTLDVLAARHVGQLVVVACHAGVVEASLLAKLPVAGGLDGARMGLRTRHASMTTWEVDPGRWTLLGYNDFAHQAVMTLAAERSGVTAGQQA
jgi:probable phosphoglycerate mutase